MTLVEFGTKGIEVLFMEKNIVRFLMSTVEYQNNIMAAFFSFRCNKVYKGKKNPQKTLLFCILVYFNIPFLKFQPAYGGPLSAALGKKDLSFPADCVESVGISTAKRKRLTHKDLGEFTLFSVVLKTFHP